jgi:hypothetical protein
MITPLYDVASDAAREWRRLSMSVEASGKGAAARLMRQFELHSRPAAIQRFIELQCSREPTLWCKGRSESVMLCIQSTTEDLLGV